MYFYPMRNVINLSDQNTLLTLWINELRSVEIQNDRLRFRRNLERIGEIGAYEISKTLVYKDIEVKTPLATTQSKTFDKQPVVLTILRAGVPLFNGVSNYFDLADCGFVGAYRKHSTGDDFTIQQDYVTSPDITDRPLIITDPMLATGASLIEATHEILKIGKPSSLHFLCVIASKKGVETLMNEFPESTLWCGTIDEELNSKGYIVPGLGDAGDLAFGSKLQH